MKYAFLLLLLAFASCKVVLVETDCLKVVAAEISEDGKLVSIDSVRFSTDKNCKKMSKATYVSYRERNGKPGYQSEPEPADDFVDHVAADLGGQPSSQVSISNVTNQSSDHGYADSWQINIEFEGGGTSVFSGTF